MPRENRPRQVRGTLEPVEANVCSPYAIIRQGIGFGDARRSILAEMVSV